MLLAGAGVGITPLRALADGLEYGLGEAILLQRYTVEQLFKGELETVAAHRGLHVVNLPGPRHALDLGRRQAACGVSQLITLQRWIPDIAEREVFLCGSSTWTDGMKRAGPSTWRTSELEKVLTMSRDTC